MKMNKNMAMIIAGAVVLFLVYWFFFRKKTTKTESGYMTWLGLPSENGYTKATSDSLLPTGCPAGQVPCGYSKTGCCPESSNYAKIEVPKNSTVQFPKANATNVTVAPKCPDGYLAFQVTTPGGVKWGCKNQAKIGREMWADPL